MRSESFKRLCLLLSAIFTFAVDPALAGQQTARSVYDRAIVIRNTAKSADEIRLAIPDFELAAALGEDRALLALGDLYAEAKVGIPDEDLAKAFYDVAAEHGLVVESLNRMARLYRSPDGRFFDLGEALALYEQAAGLGDLDARIAAAELLSDGIGMKTQEKKAASYFEMALRNAPDPAVTAKLASLYRSKEGELHDPAMARQLYETAAASGDKKSLMAIGQMLAEGELGTPDETAAEKYFSEALQKYQLPDAGLRLARLYRSPGGSLHDVGKAIALLEELASAGNMRADLELARIYADRQDAMFDEDRSESYLLKAKAAFEGEASRVLGDIYMSPAGSKHDPGKALGFYKRAAELGDTGAMTVVGDALAEGNLVARDEEMAIDFYRSAAKDGLTGGLLRRIGNLYRSRDGALFEVGQAIDYFERAAALSDARAMLILGDIFAQGEGVTANEERAEQYYAAAIAADKTIEAGALRDQASLYRSSSGNLYDPAKAESLYQKAAALGDTQSMVALGEMYSEGEFARPFDDELQ